jgi:hypothetical protein
MGIRTAIASCPVFAHSPEVSFRFSGYFIVESDFRFIFPSHASSSATV